ncbi:MAG: hypothetical protein EBW58_09300 [Betaproteobacteria bacterium]|nr:hypothetical protein [Betaproteobacteria bacterium]
MTQTSVDSTYKFTVGVQAMKNDTNAPNSLRRMFGGASMLAGTVTLMVSPVIVGSNPIPEGVLIFGLASMLGGWATMLTGEKTSNDQVQPSMGD